MPLTRHSTTSPVQRAFSIAITALFVAVAFVCIQSKCLHKVHLDKQPDIAEWHTCRNEKAGYAFQYPAEWNVYGEDARAAGSRTIIGTSTCSGFNVILTSAEPSKLFPDVPFIQIDTYPLSSTEAGAIMNSLSISDAWLNNTHLRTKDGLPVRQSQTNHASIKYIVFNNHLLHTFESRNALNESSLTRLIATWESL